MKRILLFFVLMCTAMAILVSCGKQEERDHQDREETRRTQATESNEPEEPSHSHVSETEESEPEASDSLVSEDPSHSQVSEVEESESEAITMELVTDAYSEEFGGRRFRIPQINLPGETVADINGEIWTELYDGVVAEKRQWWEQEHFEGYEYIIYDWNVFNGVLSLLIESHPVDWEWTDYYVYNVSVETGERLSDEDMISMVGWTQETYVDRATQSLGCGYFRGKEGYIEQIGYSDFFYTQLENTLSEENIQSCKPYFNENGQLSVVAAVYSLAGAEYYYGVHNLEEIEENAAFGEYMNTQAGNRGD